MKKKTPAQITKKNQEKYNGTTDAIKFLSIVGQLYLRAKSENERQAIAEQARQAEILIYNNKGRF